MFGTAWIVVACLFIFASPVGAGGEDALSTDRSGDGAASVNEWVGKNYDDLVSAYGKPSKIRKHDDGGRTVIFKISITGELVVHNRALEVGISDNAYIEAEGHITPANPMGTYFIDAPSEPHAIILGKQKLTFHVTADGTIDEVEIAPVKWKKHAMERSLEKKEPPKEEQEAD